MELIEINKYADQHNLSLEEVWNKMKSGEIFGKTIGDSLFIFNELHLDHENSNNYPELDLPRGEHPTMDQELPNFLPPLPNKRAGAEAKQKKGATLLPMLAHGAESGEMALLIDHLSIAKEENREILRLAQDSIARITSMSDEILKAKEKALQTKDDEIVRLKQDLEQITKHYQKLRQDFEDLEILSKVLSEKTRSL